jgi:hypothetical protein
MDKTFRIRQKSYIEIGSLSQPFAPMEATLSPNGGVQTALGITSLCKGKDVGYEHII